MKMKKPWKIVYVFLRKLSLVIVFENKNSICTCNWSIQLIEIR
jgi:hypothetical protein